MTILQLYNKLLQFPLFLGMSKDDLSNLVEHTRFGFVKYEKEKTILKEGQLCDKLYFLTDGCISIKKYSDSNNYSIEEEIHSPYVFSIEHVFGLLQKSPATYKALGTCNFIVIDKEEVLKLSDEFFIFKINMFNLLSTQLQKLNDKPWRKHPDNTRGTITRFIKDRCIYPAGKKRFNIHMKILAKETNEGLLNTSRELNKMEEEKLIQLHRGGFEIPALERLLM